MNNHVKRVLAILAIVLLVALYVTTLIAALIGSDVAINLFKSCVVGTITIPILLWIFVSIFKRMQPQVSEEDDTDSTLEHKDN